MEPSPGRSWPEHYTSSFPEIWMRSPHRLSRRQKRPRIVEMACLPLGPLIKTRNINDDLTVGSQFYVGSVHWSGSRSFKIDAFVVVPTTVAGTPEFVLAVLPINPAHLMSS